MTLQERIQQELKASMLARNADKTSLLRQLKSAIGYVQIERKVDSLSDADVTALIQKEVKKRRDSIEQFTTGGRPELAEKEAQEISLLEAFLPQPFSADELVKPTVSEIRLYLNGNLVRVSRQSIQSGISIMGGDRETDESWFVVVRRDKPS